MNHFRFGYADWISYPDEPDREEGETVTKFSMYADDICITQNEDGFEKGVLREYAIMSLHPLAIWFAANWWRLHYEIMPADRYDKRLLHSEWRASHEMISANCGYLWPIVIFAPDQDAMNIRVRDAQYGPEQSLRYLNGASQHTTPKKQFFKEVSGLIERVIARLEDVGLKNTDLAQLWALIQEDQSSPETLLVRQIEAHLGFDPEECPPAMVKQAIALQQRLGSHAFTELTGAYAEETGAHIDSIQALIDAKGIKGDPDHIPDLKLKTAKHPPWQPAVSAARELRKKISQPEGILEDKALYDLLGVSGAAIKQWQPEERAKVSLAGRMNGGKMNFIPRRSHPRSRRFELARFIGDYVLQREADASPWLVTADLSTTRQKFQRAFAAEFLCPIDELVEFMGGDFSDSAVEDATDHFMVSEKAVGYQLENNGYFSGSVQEADLPYDVSA